MRSPVAFAIAFLLLAFPLPAQQSPNPPPISTLPLRLLGVAMDATAPARSAGVIQCGTAQELRAARVYTVGERACDVAEIVEVLERALVIRNLQADRLELLAFRADRPAPAPAAAPDAAERARPDEPPQPLVETVGPSVVSIEISRDLLRRYLSNLPDVLTAATATPRYASGVIEGYELSHVQAGSVLEQLGLQNGDVVLEFDGRKLDGLTAVTSLLGRLQSLSDAKVTVLRAGTKTTLLYAVR